MIRSNLVNERGSNGIKLLHHFALSAICCRLVGRLVGYGDDHHRLVCGSVYDCLGPQLRLACIRSFTR
jgi:hypothetical protein